MISEFNFPENSFARDVPIVHPLSNNEIIIMGGAVFVNGHNKCLNDAYLFNTISEKCQKTNAQWVTGFESGSNSVALINANNIVSLVINYETGKKALI